MHWGKKIKYQLNHKNAFFHSHILYHILNTLFFHFFILIRIHKYFLKHTHTHTHTHSLYLSKLGLAPEIESLHGAVEFSEEELLAMNKKIDESGVVMPQFSALAEQVTFCVCVSVCVCVCVR